MAEEEAVIQADKYNQLRIHKKPKTWFLPMRDGTKLEVKKYGDDRFGKYGGKTLLCPILDVKAINWWAGEINFATAHKWDVPVQLTGREGSGKSGLAALLARGDPNNRIMGPGLNPDLSLEDIAFTTKEFAKRVHNSKPLDTIVLDEAGHALYHQEWMQKEQRDIVKLFEVFRIKRLKIILCLPRAKYLNAGLRNDRIQWWGHVYAVDYDQRGYAQLRSAPLRDSAFGGETYWNGEFTLRYPDYEEIDKKFWSQYEKYKKEFVDSETFKTAEGDIRTKSEAKNKLIDSCRKLKKDMNWTLEEIADHYRLDLRTVTKWVEGYAEVPNARGAVKPGRSPAHG